MLPSCSLTSQFTSGRPRHNDLLDDPRVARGRAGITRKTDFTKLKSGRRNPEALGIPEGKPAGLPVPKVTETSAWLSCTFAPVISDPYFSTVILINDPNNL